MSACSLHEKKWRVKCTVYTPRRLQQIATSCKRNLLQQTGKWIILMSSTSFWTCPTWGRTVPSLILVKRNRFCTFFAWFSVEAVHACDCGSEVWSKSHRSILARFVSCEIPLFLISGTPLWTDGRNGLPVPTYPFRCTSARSSQFWVANHDLLGLVEDDREFLRNFLWDISSARCGPHSTLSVLQFCRAEHHEVAPSWLRSAG